MNKKILLVRHAESIANIGFATSDVKSIPLSPHGILQAKNLAENFPIVPDLIVTSSFLRTQETARPLIEKIPNARVEIWDLIHEFTFLDRNKQKNKTPEQRKPFTLEYWKRKDPFYQDGPEEESFLNLLLRAESFVQQVKNRKENVIVVFTHGQFLNALKLIKNLPSPVETLTKNELANLMDAIVELQAKSPIANATVIDLDDLVVG